MAGAEAEGRRESEAEAEDERVSEAEGVPLTDIKIPCTPGTNDCGDLCVNGYGDLHCVKRSCCL